MNMPQQRNILITGANGALGLAITEYFLKQDDQCRVLMGVRSNRSNAEALKNQYQERCELIELDVSIAQDWETQMAKIQEKYGDLHVLVNNAGYHADGLVANMSLEQWNRVIQTNLTAAFLGSQAVLKSMIAARFGRIVNIASLSALHAPAGQANYAAAKAGMLGLTSAMAKEVGRLGVTVNAICPAHIEGAHPAEWSEEQLKTIKRSHPMRRFATAKEVASAVYYLASQDAAYINGTHLVIDGGMV
jgi:3-oxoacyl-[acyl-carrier protein] reductase